MSPALSTINPVIGSLKNSSARTATSVGHKTYNILTHLWWGAYLQKCKILAEISQEKYFQGNFNESRAATNHKPQWQGVRREGHV